MQNGQYIQALKNTINEKSTIFVEIWWNFAKMTQTWVSQVAKVSSNFDKNWAFFINSTFWGLYSDLKRFVHFIVHFIFTRWPDSNPGRPGELFQNHVAMSRCTNWPPNLSTKMVTDHCTLNIQPCTIHFCVRSNILVKMMYHTCLYAKCTMVYNHICTQIS